MVAGDVGLGAPLAEAAVRVRVILAGRAATPRALHDELLDVTPHVPPPAAA